MSFAGRPTKPIDWELVDQLLIYGCSATEIAPHFNVHRDTLSDRLRERTGMLFTEYSAIMFEKGNSVLRKAQYEKAELGDNTMLVWLGKNRLKQRDAPVELTVTQLQVDTNTAIMAQLTKAQEDDSLSDM